MGLCTRRAQSIIEPNLSQCRGNTVQKGQKFLSAAIAILVVTCLFANEEISDYRHESMEAIGVHFDSVVKIVRGELPFKDHLSKHVDALADYADMMADMFAEGSEGGEALDKIWEEPEEFANAIEEFKTAISEFKDLVDSGADDDEINKAFRATGGTCKGCHDSYRE